MKGEREREEEREREGRADLHDFMSQRSKHTFQGRAHFNMKTIISVTDNWCSFWE